MSMMYGKRRVVLRKSGLIVVCGSDSPGRGGNYFPLGYWYWLDGLFYADLKSSEQWYAPGVNRETIANKHRGGTPTKVALRQYVMGYWDSHKDA